MQVTVPDGLRAMYHHQRFFIKEYGRMRMPDELVLAGEHHGREKYGTPLGRGGFTTCSLVDAAGYVVAQGHAECHENDNFNRKLGRTIALGRALKDLNS